MTTIVTRAGKGSELTHTEVDANFTNLNNNKVETSALSNYQPLDADLTAIAALSGTTGLLKKTAANTWSLDTSAYITGNQTITFSGDASGSGTTSVTLTLATVPVSKGGTGATTLTGLVKGNGTSAFTAVTAPSGTIVGTSDTQTLTNKTLTTPVLTASSSVSGGALGYGSGFLKIGTGSSADLVVTEVNTMTLYNKTIEAGTFTNGYTEEVATANTSTAYTIDLANGSVQVLTLTGNCTYTFPTATAGKSFLLVQKQDATGSRTATWPAAVKWPSSTAPTLTSTASKADVFAFTADGTNWYGRIIGQNYL